MKLSVARSRYVVDRINRLAPDFVVDLGDITHPEPGTPAYEDSAARFRGAYAELNCPLQFVPGNHDIGEKAFSGEPLAVQHAQRTVNDDIVAEYERHFQPQYHAFEHEDCLFVIVNGMIVNSGLPCEQEQKARFEILLADNAGRRVFMFSHYPAYLSRPDETGHYDATDEPGRSWLLGLLERHRIEAYFADHVQNFFFNRHGATNCYVLPSTCFLRHDYHEMFRTAPGIKQGRHDGAKLGFAIVDVFRKGHIQHIIRSWGHALEEAETPEPDPPVALPMVHALAPGHSRVGVYLRQPWCDNADIPTPRGLDAFHCKRLRNDYPLMALWEMGVRDLCIPLDDLAAPETRVRIGRTCGTRPPPHRLFLRPRQGAAHDTLKEHGHHLAAWKVIAPTTSLTDLPGGMAADKGSVPVPFNAFRTRYEAFSCSHGL